MANPTIRLAQLDESNLVSQLIDAAYSKWIPLIGRKPAPMLADYPALIAQGYVHVLETNNSIAGVLVIWPMDDSLYIDNVAVHPDFQRQGIGEKLLNFAEQQGREAGLPMLRLLTNEKFESNQLYYRKHGYSETRRETGEDGRRTVWMHKNLGEGIS